MKYFRPRRYFPNSTAHNNRMLPVNQANPWNRRLVFISGNRFTVYNPLKNYVGAREHGIFCEKGIYFEFSGTLILGIMREMTGANTGFKCSWLPGSVALANYWCRYQLEISLTNGEHYGLLVGFLCFFYSLYKTPVWSNRIEIWQSADIMQGFSRWRD